ncbi:MAG TPA: 50S ribosomal protein L21, partial [Gemmatimonadales bacterium]|nr:50S ribosomal protein L21 [Gemmatimonadales bacterium]
LVPSAIGVYFYGLTLYALAEERGMYAIIRAGGKQFRAEKGKTLKLPLMSAEAGSKITFDEVLLSSDGQTIKTGTPLVSGAKVTAEIVGEGKEPKIYVFKFKRRKNYRRKTGHRQRYTEVRITDVKLG